MIASFPYTLLVIFLVALVAFLTRILPFIFSSALKNSAVLTSIGKYLPPYIMLLLVLFEIGLSKFEKAPYNIPAVAGLLVLVAVHWWKQKVLLSILVSVVVYIVFTYVCS
ncbi:MAG: AzlD domain-containing protein [Coxiellaceae bacterium]|nr:AzlD domain-containing protein [Coxiellaceae bacterium]